MATTTVYKSLTAFSTITITTGGGIGLVLGLATDPRDALWRHKRYDATIASPSLWVRLANEPPQYNLVKSLPRFRVFWLRKGSQDDCCMCYQKALDSSLAYDDLALHSEHDLEKVHKCSPHLSHPIGDGTARDSNLLKNKCPLAANATVVPSTGHEGSMVRSGCRVGRKDLNGCMLVHSAILGEHPWPQKKTFGPGTVYRTVCRGRAAAETMFIFLSCSICRRSPKLCAVERR